MSNIIYYIGPSLGLCSSHFVQLKGHHLTLNLRPGVPELQNQEQIHWGRRGESWGLPPLLGDPRTS